MRDNITKKKPAAKKRRATKKRLAAKKAPALSIEGGLWLDRKGQSFVGDRRIALLESIDLLGSITQAAKHVGLSYKAAWDAVDAMSNLAEKPLLVRATGGAHGGGSRLTEHGREVVRLYRLLESGYRRLLTKMQDEVDDIDKLSDLIRAIVLRTSARNQLKGTVKSIRLGVVNAVVVLDLGGGLEVFANVTHEAVEDLDLKPGREAVALIKSNFIMLTTDPNIRISARNRLPGTVVKIVPGGVNSEVKLRLEGGRTLTTVVTNQGLEELGLAEGTPCCALVKASNVLIAVND